MKWPLYPFREGSRDYERRLGDAGIPEPGDVILQFACDRDVPEPYYILTESDYSVFEKLYGNSDPYHPPWHKIRADLMRTDPSIRVRDLPDLTANVVFEILRRHPGETRSDAENDKAADGELPECLVTLQQAAPFVNRSKRTLERLTNKKGFPRPKIVGGGGKPNEYVWSELRTFLGTYYGRDLPDAFPGQRFRPV